MAEVETEDLVKKEWSLFAVSSSACWYTPPCGIFQPYTQGVFHHFMEGVQLGYTRSVYTHWNTGQNSFSGPLSTFLMKWIVCSLCAP